MKLLDKLFRKGESAEKPKTPDVTGERAGQIGQWLRASLTEIANSGTENLFFPDDVAYPCRTTTREERVGF